MPYVNQAIEKKHLFSRRGSMWPLRHESLEGVRNPASVKLLLPLGLLMVSPSHRPLPSGPSNRSILGIFARAMWTQPAQATRLSAAAPPVKMLPQRQNKVAPTSSIKSLSTKSRASLR